MNDKVSMAAEQLESLDYKGMGEWWTPNGKVLGEDDVHDLNATLAEAYLHPPDLLVPVLESSQEMTDFQLELDHLINRHSMENGSDTPDFILAKYLKTCLDAFDAAVRRRTEWYKPTDD